MRKGFGHYRNRALNISWRDRVTNEDLYGDLLNITRKVKGHRLNAASHLYCDQEEATSRFVL